MRDAGVYLRENNWDEAYSQWKIAYEKRKGQQKMKAAFNIALYYEIKDNVELAEELPEGQAVGKLNVEEYQSMAQKFQVRGIPTMILFENGKEINRFVGVKTKDFLKKNMQ
jgi:thioredoxin-related protein